MEDKPINNKPSMTVSQNLLEIKVGKEERKSPPQAEIYVEKCVKKTSPRQMRNMEVKTTSTPRAKQTCSSPNLLTRMKPLRKTRQLASLRLDKPMPRNSPVKTRNFNSILESWEITSNAILTSASNIPKLSTEAASQPQKSSQNKKISRPGISHLIGQEKLENGSSRQSSQWQGVWENRGKIGHFSGK